MLTVQNLEYVLMKSFKVSSAVYLFAAVLPAETLFADASLEVFLAAGAFFAAAFFAVDFLAAILLLSIFSPLRLDAPRVVYTKRLRYSSRNARAGDVRAILYAG